MFQKLSFLSIPRETSPQLSDLLLGLLQRNQKDRMDFGECSPKYVHSHKMIKHILQSLLCVLSPCALFPQTHSSVIPSWSPHPPLRNVCKPESSLCSPLTQSELNTCLILCLFPPSLSSAGPKHLHRSDRQFLWQLAMHPLQLPPCE